MKHWMAAVLAVGTLSTIVSVAATQQKEWSFPNTKSIGRATVEYNDGFHAVANYDYSQRAHNTPWLLIDLAAASTRRFVLHRDHIRLLTPDGRELKMATHKAILDDRPGINLVLQNAQIWRRGLESYFNQRGVNEWIRFHNRPEQGVVSDEAIVDNDRVTIGELFFKSPEGRWQTGTYRLTIENDVAKAALPIVLQ